jgi:hypothetical protein
MDIRRIISELDAEIAKLQTIRSQIAGYSAAPAAAAAPGKVAGRRGRPKGSKNAVKKTAAKKARRVLSPEARKRIADAQKKRWAERRAPAKKESK